MDSAVNFHMLITLAVLAVMICCFASGKIRTDVIAVTGLVVLLLTNTLTPNEALVGFSNPVVVMMASVFIIGGAIVRTGLAQQASRKILGFAGTNQYAIFSLVMLVTAVIGSIVSNTGTVAIMMPIVVSLAKSIKVSSSRFLMPLAFMSSMGGMLTLIGNSPNMVISEFFVGAGYPALNFFSFLPIGLICVAFGLFILCPFAAVLLSQKKIEKSKGQKHLSFDELIDKYRLDQHLYVVHVPEKSVMAGQTLAELDLPEKFSASVVEVKRSKAHKKPFGQSQVVRQLDPGPQTKILANDVLYVSASLSSIHQMAHAYGLDYKGSATSVESEGHFESFGVCEVVVLTTSRYVGQKVADAGLRSKHGITLLAIQRKNYYIVDEIKDQTIQAGDILLVQGTWKILEDLQQNPTEWVVMGRPLEEAVTGSLKRKIPYVICILIGMIITMSTGLLPTVTAVLVAALLMVAIGSFKSIDEAYSYINWESVILIACMLPLSFALQKTGVIDLFARSLEGVVTDASPYLVLAIVYGTASLLNFFITSTATTLLIAPIALTIATSLGLSPYPFLFGVAMASNATFASPFSTPSNALVMSAGRYTFLDYIKIGLPMQVLLGIIMIFALPLLYPFYG